MKAKHPVHIMVFRVVTSNGYIMTLFIFHQGLTVNMEANIKCLDREMVAGRPFIWQYEPSVGCEKISATTFFSHLTA